MQSLAIDPDHPSSIARSMLPILEKLLDVWRMRCDDIDHIIRKGQTVMDWILIDCFLNNRLFHDIGQIARCRALAQKSFLPLFLWLTETIGFVGDLIR